MIYEIGWFNFKGRLYPRICQDKGGPCPLIAVCNVLILRRILVIPQNMRSILFEQIVKELRRILNEKIRRLSFNSSEKTALYLQQHQDLLELLPTLEEGLDVNVKFDGPEYFEYTKNSSLFDMFDIPCYHCWRADKQHQHYTLLKGLSYNEMVDCLTTELKDDATEEEKSELHIKQEAYRTWLQETQHQITAKGVEELHGKLRVGVFGILFRNNHFSTIYRSPQTQQIYSLVTDIGVVALDPAILWNTIDNLQGDDAFLDMNFRTLTQRRRQQENENQSRKDAQLARAIVEREIQDQRLAQILQKEENERNRQQMIQDDRQLKRGRDLRNEQKPTCCIVS